MKTESSRDIPPPFVFLDLVNGSWISQAIYAAAKLGIADLLAEGPKRSEELAKATETHPRALYRLLRALASLGVCRDSGDGVFELAPLGAYLRTGADGSVRSWTLLWGGSVWPAWGNLLESVKTGEPAWSKVHGSSFFDFLTKHPEEAAVFNQAMVEWTYLLARDLVRVYDFSSTSKIVDVGGGYGELLAALLRANPEMRGVLFDLPHSIDGARRHLAAAGVVERCELIGGSFFDSVPAGADAYLLKNIIHDWDDDKSRVILDRCRQAIPKHGKLLLVESVVPERMEASAANQEAAFRDLNMLVVLGACERTEREFGTLLAEAGFRLSRVIPVVAGWDVIEGVPV